MSDFDAARYPRDMVGYADSPPLEPWPDGARLAVQIVLNYEEGGESCVLHGDPASETFLSEIISAKPYPARHMSMESLYEYGSRAGFWRLHRVFVERRLPITVFAVSMALQRNPTALAAMQAAGWEVACHGYRWIDHQFLSEAEERDHITRALTIHTQLTGGPPLGWYTGRDSPNTRRLVLEKTELLYDSDSYADDLPYWIAGPRGAHLIIPYTLDTNDMRFATAQGFNTGEQFYQYLKDAFDVLYAEGAHAPKLLNIGLHCRIVGRPARLAGLLRFLDYAEAKEGVWWCRREDIARHWHLEHQPQ